MAKTNTKLPLLFNFGQHKGHFASKTSLLILFICLHLKPHHPPSPIGNSEWNVWLATDPPCQDLGSCPLRCCWREVLWYSDLSPALRAVPGCPALSLPTCLHAHFLPGWESLLVLELPQQSEVWRPGQEMSELQTRVVIESLSRLHSSGIVLARYYCTVQHSTVQYSTVQYSTVQYSTVQGAGGGAGGGISLSQTESGHARLQDYSLSEGTQ